MRTEMKQINAWGPRFDQLFLKRQSCLFKTDKLSDNMQGALDHSTWVHLPFCTWATLPIKGTLKSILSDIYGELQSKGELKLLRKDDI